MRPPMRRSDATDAADAKHATRQLRRQLAELQKQSLNKKTKTETVRSLADSSVGRTDKWTNGQAHE